VTPPQQRSRHAVGEIERLGHVLVQRDIALPLHPRGARRLDRPTIKVAVPPMPLERADAD
jgi:hypothetical protein